MDQYKPHGLWQMLPGLLMAVLVILLSCISFYCYAQQYADRDLYLVDSLVIEDLSPKELQTLDSLLLQFNAADHDTSRARVLAGIYQNLKGDAGLQYMHLQHNKVADYLANSRDTLVAIALKEHLQQNSFDLGYHYTKRGDPDKAIAYYTKSLELAEHINAEDKTSATHYKLAKLYEQIGNLPIALQHYFKSLEISQRLNEYQNLLYVYSGIAQLYSDQYENEMAVEYALKALELSKEAQDTAGIQRSLELIGFINLGTSNYQESLKYSKQALEMAKVLRDGYALAVCNSNIGSAYRKLGQYDQAMEYYIKTVPLMEEAGDKIGLTASYINITRVWYQKNDLARASTNVKIALKMSQDLGHPRLISRSAGLYSQIEEDKGNYAIALEMRNLEILMRDSIENEANEKLLYRRDIQYKYAQKAALDSAANAQLLAIKDATLHEQEALIKQGRYQKLALGAGLIVLLCIGGLLFQRYRVTKIKKELVEKQKQLDMSLVLSDNKMRHEFNAQLIEKLEGFGRLDDTEMRRSLGSYIIDVKNQLGIEDRLEYLSDNLDELHSAFDEHLAKKFPGLSASEREICHMIRLNLSIKEIANLRRTSEGAIKTARHRIKTKLRLDDQSLDEFIKQEM